MRREAAVVVVIGSSSSRRKKVKKVPDVSRKKGSMWVKVRALCLCLCATVVRCEVGRFRNKRWRFTDVLYLVR